MVVTSGSYLTFEEIEKILRVAENLEHRMFIKTLFITGARISEIVGQFTEPGEPRSDALIPERISFERGFIILRNLKAKKKTVRVKKRWKEINPPIEYMEELKDYIEERKIGPKEPVFNFSRFTGYRIVRAVCKKAGFEHIADGKFAHPHTMRHSFCVHGVREGVDFKHLQKQTGHATVDMLLKYRTLRKEDIERERDKMWRKLKEK